MRSLSTVLISLIAGAVCVLMTYLSLGSGFYTVLFNLIVLGIMLLIILFAWIFGFVRMKRTQRGLDEASRKLIAVYKNQADMADITRAGAQIFEVEYLDRKYQEYLGYLRKTNSPCDIGDYIGEYEINNYTHRRLVEMVPDILTSLGILGTFMGLVWGLRGFNPVSYEAMASSITSLIDGIKVAFITSIYGIALSIPFSYALRGALTAVSESLDNFLDKYYLCAVSPTDATAMNHVLANQKEQTRVIENLGGTLSDQLAEGMSENLRPVMSQINDTLENFTNVVTLNQQELLENVAAQVMAAMKKEFIAEFVEMRSMLKETNKVQREYLDYITKAQDQFEANLRAGSKEMTKAIEASGQTQKAAMDELQVQQRNLSEFVDYMSKCMASLSQMTDASNQTIEAINGQIDRISGLTQKALDYANDAGAAAGRADDAADRAEYPPQRIAINDIDELTGRLDQMILLLERQQRAMQQRKGLFR